MPGMKVNLEGYFSNVVSNLPRDERSYHTFCFDEILGHIKDVVAGRHTIEEFAEHYCLAKPSTSIEGEGK